MLTIDISVWPFGDFRKQKVIDRICIANVGTSEDGIIADYVARSYRSTPTGLIPVDTGFVEGFNRRSGATALLFMSMAAMTAPQPHPKLAQHADTLADIDIVANFERQHAKKPAYRRVTKLPADDDKEQPKIRKKRSTRAKQP